MTSRTAVAEKRNALRNELRPMAELALPVVLAELGWMAMGVVDTMMVGRVGAEAIGAVSVGNIVFNALIIFGSGLLLGLDTVVSQAFGADDLEDCHHSLLQAVYLTLALSPVLMGIVFLGIPFLREWGLHPDVVEDSILYMRAVTWSTFPLLLYTAFRRYLQGMNLVRPAMVVLITANLVNAASNWILIFGHFGLPALGAEGAGWATFISRTYMCGALLGYILYRELRGQTGLLRIPLRLDLRRMRRLTRLGFPAAMQISLEVGVLAVATMLAGKLNPVSLAAHQIALNAASVTFMVPLGISSAGAVRVGQALGRRDPEGARQSGWMALLLGAAFMLFAGLVFFLAPGLIVRIYTTDATVISTGVSLLLVAAFFQLFDGVQVVATGVLRGAGDTRTPMITNLLGHWFLGLPVGYLLCFRWNWGVQGIWIGLCVGFIVVGLVLLLVWSQKVNFAEREAYAGF